MLIPKHKRYESKRLRDVPRDLDVLCVECGNPECCLAHIPYHDAGTGQKTHDYLGAHLCQRCHDYMDGRDGEGGNADYEFKLRVLRRTIERLFRMEVIGELR